MPIIHEVTARVLDDDKQPIWYELLKLEYNELDGTITIDEGPNANIINLSCWPYKFYELIKILNLVGWQHDFRTAAMESYEEKVNRVILTRDTKNPSTTDPSQVIVLIREACWQLPLKTPVNIEISGTAFETKLIFNPKLVATETIDGKLKYIKVLREESIIVDTKECKIGIITIKTNPIYGSPEYINQATAAVSDLIKKHQRFPREIT